MLSSFLTESSKFNLNTKIIFFKQIIVSTLPEAFEEIAQQAVLTLQKDILYNVSLRNSS